MYFVCLFENILKYVDEGGAVWVMACGLKEHYKQKSATL